MRPWSSERYAKEAAEKNAPLAVAQEAYAQARLVQSKGLPAVLTLKHLAMQAGVSYNDLRDTVSRARRRSYRFFKMQKRGGGHRLICVPQYTVAAVQKWISVNILRRVPAHPSSGAYSPGCSPLAVAQAHCGCRWLVKLDVREFFESISERQVFHAFRSLGYQPLISFEMARLCTRTYVSSNARDRKRRWRRIAPLSASTIRQYAHDTLGHLPQGAATSPMLSNLVMRDFDALASAYAAKHGLTYSRYADDLIFSTASPVFTRSSALEVIRWINALMRAHGFRPHTAKAVVAPPGARKLVLGLLVDREAPRLQSSLKKRLLQEVYALEKFGPAAHSKSRGWRSPLAMQLHLGGLLRYAGSIQPDFADPLLARFSAIFPSTHSGAAT